MLDYFKKNYPLFFILLIPILFRLINSNSVEPTIGYLDEWIYYGYSRHYDDPSFLSNDYKISRLPWILYLYGMRSIFPIEVLNLMIQLCMLIPTLFFVLITSRRMFGLIPTCFVGIFFALYPFLVSNGGAYYNNSLSGFFYAVTFYLVTDLAQRKRFCWLRWIILGVFIGLLLHTNIMFINLTPLLLFQYYFVSVNKLDFLNFWFKKLMFLILGALLITAILGATNKYFGRDFFFYLPIFKMAFSYVADSAKQKEWWLPFQWEWYSNATYLVELLGVAAYSILALVLGLKIRKIYSNAPIEFGLIFQFIFVLVLWHIWQMIGQTSFYPFDYFAYPLIIPAIYSFGAATALVLHISSIKNKVLVVAISLSCILFYLTLRIEFISGSIIYFFSYFGKFTIVILFIFILISNLILKNDNKPVVLMGLLGLTSAIVVAYSGHATNYLNEKTVCKTRQSNFKIMETIQERINSSNKTSHVYVWFDKNEKNTLQGCAGELNSYNFAMSLGQTGFSYINSPWNGMPEIETLDMKEILSKVGKYPQTIITISLENDNFNDSFKRLLEGKSIAIKKQEYFEVVGEYNKVYLNLTSF